ncbi:hypothetical protein DERF_005182 [Dermatophagoides farinae]|uniref:Uncharacterized protein n=1 Tax=Dermatophagoides farinae TaxID=6954 RepID=A0A922I5C5_DERFA|nr:hypothetical protein DERF_005182 [Dermatophagoides farinae]
MELLSSLSFIVFNNSTSVFKNDLTLKFVSHFIVKKIQENLSKTTKYQNPYPSKISPHLWPPPPPPLSSSYENEYINQLLTNIDCVLPSIHPSIHIPIDFVNNRLLLNKTPTIYTFTLTRKK